jgi:hypothetical protein
MTYFHQRFHDEGTRALVAEPLNGVPGVEAVLVSLGKTLTFEEFFADWLAANYLDGEPGALPLHVYEDLQLVRPAASATIEGAPALVDGSVGQLGADYIVLRGNDDVEITFQGVTETALLDLRPYDGATYWWSNRADESQSTLTTSLDLAGFKQATLGYWAWYDMEPGFDYAFVEVSLDGGAQWENVPASSSSGRALAADSPEWVYTGSSGTPPRWVYETVDLSSFAGEGAVAVRFVYLTDGAVTGPGLALDGIRIADTDSEMSVDSGALEWKAEGFLETDGAVRQQYLGVLIGLGDRITVQRLPIEASQIATWPVPLRSNGWREAVLVVAGLAPLTGQPARYSLAVEPARADN